MMRVGALLLALLVAGMAIPNVAAEATTDCAAVPCGYVTPIIDLEFEGKPGCGTGGALGVAVSGDNCIAIPEIGQSVTFQGTLRWYWDITNDAIYPNDPLTPIAFDFSGTRNNPDWIDFSVEPSTFELNTQDLFNPLNWDIQTEGTVAVIDYDFQQPITITFTRTGEVSEKSIEKMQNRDGVLPFFLKAHSTASGNHYMEAYGLEEFRFHADTNEDVAKLLDHGSNDTPGPGMVVALVGLVGLAATLRRRS